MSYDLNKEKANNSIKKFSFNNSKLPFVKKFSLPTHTTKNKNLKTEKYADFSNKF